MKKETFLKELEYLLQDIPDEDKEEALSYYRDYLEEAGSENEDKVMEEFGSPERVAAIIRADITGNLKDGGSFTEKGYEDERFKDPGYQVAKRLDLPDEKETVHENRETRSESRAADGAYTNVEEKPWTSRVLKVVLLGILILAASPFLLGAGGIAVGTVAGIASLFFWSGGFTFGSDSDGVYSGSGTDGTGRDLVIYRTRGWFASDRNCSHGNRYGNPWNRIDLRYLWSTYSVLL